ncbi:MAG: FAD-dependent oxidoreductase, partial [Candidatus Nanopelagicales bacterium]|nr:FAD-dependent oxidoreductase [Candidatus Nanopelagicales bacterium]
MTTTADVIVLGLGPGGEQVANDLLSGGLSVIGIEAELVGGECPYWGCIPSKMAIRAATTLAEGRRVNELAGTATITPDWSPVAQRIRAEATDDWNDQVAVDRFVDAGGTFVRGRGTITGTRSVRVGDRDFAATRALVIATGTSAAIPPVDGLADLDYWTNRDALKTEAVPDSLVVLGGGAIGCELAQVFRRFGAEVTIVEFAPRLIAAEEPEAGEILAQALVDEGITVRLGVS